MRDQDERYGLFIDRSAAKELDRVPERDFARIDEKIQSLRTEQRPYGVEKLTGMVHRVRVGNWRVIYVIDDDKKRVVVTHVRRRNERTYSDI